MDIWFSEQGIWAELGSGSTFTAPLEIGQDQINLHMSPEESLPWTTFPLSLL